eukprot:1190198-Pyramimonas_sp.AAC.1
MARVVLHALAQSQAPTMQHLCVVSAAILEHTTSLPNGWAIASHHHPSTITSPSHDNHTTIHRHRQPRRHLTAVHRQSHVKRRRGSQRHFDDAIGAKLIRNHCNDA